MFSSSVLKSITTRIMISSTTTAHLLLVNGEPEPASHSTDGTDLQMEDRVLKEHCGEDGGEVQEKGGFHCSRKRSLGGGNVCDMDGDDEDGFRTPVSMGHRIAAAAECPPAPKKPKPVSWRKRRLDDQKDDKLAVSMVIIKVSDEELEAMFRPVVPFEGYGDKVIKKPRRNTAACMRCEYEKNKA
ncbi:hypothetical protein SAY86_030662 [Trapa natans]|uniref:Uncharacterized protein n=1 Tax=Trapa natans TaxID=22666 RepID=A0AAN7MND8_TRANT|nr:hypothetical protein SAY86_030662 [Trapa natans]